MRILKIVCCMFLTILLFAFFVLWFFFITDRGVYLMLNTLISGVSGLKVHSVSGNWWQGVTIRGLYYQNQGVLIKSSELRIVLDFESVWCKSFCIHSLFFKDFFMCIESVKFNQLFLLEDSKRALARMVRMRPITFRNIILNNVYFKLDSEVILLNKCSTGLAYHKKSFTIFPTFFSGLKILHFFNFSKIKIPKFKAVSLKNIFFNKPYVSSILGDFFSEFSCKKKKLRKIMSYNLIFERIEGENIVFSNYKNFSIKKICIQGIFSKECIQLLLLDIQSPIGKIHASGNIQCNARYPVSFIMNFQANPDLLNGERIYLIISGSLNNTICIYSDFLGSINGYLILKLSLNQFDMPLNLILNIKNLDSAFIKGSDCLIQKFYFNLNGNYNDYTLNLQSVISSERLSFFANVVMTATGNINNLVISNFNIKSSNVVLDITGMVSNKNDFTDWNVNLVLKKINMIPYYSLMGPICLSGEINMHVLFEDKYCRLKLFDIILHGVMLRSCPVYFQSLLCGNVFNICDGGIFQLFLSVGSNILNVSSEGLNDDSIITAIIQFSCLNDVFPKLNGSIFGNIKIFSKFSGSYTCLLNMIAKSFYWEDKNLKIGNVFLKGSFQYYKILQGDFKCELDHLMYNSLCISKLIFQILGNTTNHSLKMSIYTNLFDAIVRVHGFFDCINKDWHGKIIRINLIKRKINNEWDQRLMIFCRNLPNEFIFLANNLNKCVFRIGYCSVLETRKTEEFNKYFKNIYLKFEQSFFLRSSHINGEFLCSIDLMWNKKYSTFSGKIFLSGKEIEWTHMVLGKKFFVVFEDCILNILLEKEYISCNWLGRLSNCSQCSGNLELSLFDQYRCSGSLFVNNLSLIFINMFLESSNIVDGVLDLDIKISGNLLYPEIYGDIKLTNFIFQGDQIPFVMRPSKFLLSFTKYRSVLHGVIGTSRGILYMHGNISWNTIRSIYSRVRITGHNVRLNLSSRVNIDISPVIIFEMTPSLLIVKGTVDVPWGFIELRKYLQNVDISPDSIVVGQNSFDKSLRCKDSRNNFNTIMNIVVRFCGDVGFNAFGLDAKLRGNLEVIYDNKYGLGLKGCVNIPNGNFSFYGQNLLIKKGQLLFSGLIDVQPYLNIEAVRSSELIQNSSIVGIRITGPISSPEVEVFSDRASSQEEAISYLLSGQQLEMLNMNSNNTIRSVLVKLGIFQVEKFVKQFGGVLGIKDLILSTYGFGNHSQIVLSGYVAPGLQVKYGIGIFDSSATATIRYSLLSNLYLESVFGITQAIDLVYQFKY